MKTQPMVDACPNYLDSPSHMLLAYIPGFGLLAQFDHPFVVDRPTVNQVSLKGHVQLLPKASDKLRPSIKNNRLQNSVQA
jgi:hypothetical protein